PDVAQEAHAISRFFENVRGDFTVEDRELQSIEPGTERADGIVTHLRDVAAGDLHLKRLGLELGAVTARALLRRLVLAQEDADVLLVALLLEIAQKGKDALECLDVGI